MTTTTTTSDLKGKDWIVQRNNACLSTCFAPIAQVLSFQSEAQEEEDEFLFNRQFYCLSAT